jgi:DNA polymerase I-like protein with 3'-5' exonuclease and polymerase domains
MTVIAIDTETTGLRHEVDTVFGVGIALPDGRTAYIDTRTDAPQVEWLRETIPTYDTVIAHNMKFDAAFLWQIGIRLRPDQMYCTMLAASCIDEHLPSYKLTDLAQRYLGDKKDEDIWPELARIFGGRPTLKAQIGRLPQAPKELVGRYCRKDAVLALRLYEWQQAEIARQGIEAVVDFERMLLAPMLNIEGHGVRIDQSGLERAIADFTLRQEAQQTELDTLAGFSVNVARRTDMLKLFTPIASVGGWQVGGISVASTSTGQASINADALRAIEHPAAAAVLALRKTTRILDVFLKNHLAGHLTGGRIYPNYMQSRSEDGAGTVTGRFSCSRPNIQQIPARDKDLGAVVRSLFLPDPGQVFLAIDASNIDARMAMHFHNDPAICQRYRENPDFDVYTLVSKLTGLPRNPAYAGGPNSKALTLGLFFAQGPGRTAKEMSLPYTVEKDDRTGQEWLRPGPEAQAIFETFHQHFPRVRPTNDSIRETARKRGYLTVFGMRRLRFPDPAFVYKAVGSLYQSAAAAVHRQQLMDIHQELKGTGNHILLAVHDELCLSVENDPQLHTRIQEIFDAPRFGLRIPLRSSMKIGANWWACK